jgi:hypothetical protein
MRKRAVKKLNLNRETVVQLEGQQMEAVVGASSPKICTFSGYQTCGSCRVTCTTNYC